MGARGTKDYTSLDQTRPAGDRPADRGHRGAQRPRTRHQRHPPRTPRWTPARGGAQRLNVSLDSLDPERFSAIIGGGDLNAVLAGLAAARVAGFTPIKINTVVMGGINDDEIAAIVDFCGTQGFTLRLIETMRVGETGRRALDHYLPLDAVERRLASCCALVADDTPETGPALYLRMAYTGG